MSQNVDSRKLVSNREKRLRYSITTWMYVQVQDNVINSEHVSKPT